MAGTVSMQECYFKTNKIRPINNRPIYNPNMSSLFVLGAAVGVVGLLIYTSFVRIVVENTE